MVTKKAETLKNKQSKKFGVIKKPKQATNLYKYREELELHSYCCQSHSQSGLLSHCQQGLKICSSTLVGKNLINIGNTILICK